MTDIMDSSYYLFDEDHFRKQILAQLKEDFMKKDVIFIGGRGTGKTQRLIDEASRYDNSIIVTGDICSKVAINKRITAYPEGDPRRNITVISVRELTEPKDNSRVIPEIKKVIYNDPATIVIWEDNTKTVVKCQEGDTYDPEKGLSMCISKKALGNSSRCLNDVLHKFERKEENNGK